MKKLLSLIRSHFCFYFHYSRRWVIEDFALISVTERSMFPSKSFIVSGLTFRSLIHFEFIIVYGVISSVAQSCPTLWTLWTATHQPSRSITHFHSLRKLISAASVMLSKHLILCHPLLLLPSIFPSIRVFSSGSVLSHQVAKVLEFQLQHQSFQWILSIDFL